MAGLGFIHLGFLAAAAAVAVPVLIHLLFRPRAQKVKIGTLYFLRSVLRDSARRRKVRRWILLALRAAGVLLLALLFARPYRTDASAQPAERELILLIDRSASMGMQPRIAVRAVCEKPSNKRLSCSKTCRRAPLPHLAYFDVPTRRNAPRPSPQIEAAARGRDYPAPILAKHSAGRATS